MKILNDQKVKRGFLAFFATEAGRKVSAFGAGATMVGLFLGNFVPHSFGLKFYKDFVQSYENGIARPLPEKVLKRVEACMEKLNIPQYEKKIIQPFTVFGFDLFHAGSTKYKFGALLGIPVNYSYNTESDIKRSEVYFRGQPINWNSESGKLLQEAIVLQEDEQMFGICKSLLKTQSHRVLISSLFPSLSFLTVYTIGHYLNMSLKLFARPLSLRLVLYSLLGMFGVGIWSFAKDFTEVNDDANIDKELSDLGPDFIEAGIRYYDKVLKKNIALRELLQNDTYTAKGNINYFIRQKSMPLTMRKSYFEEKWKELQEKSQSENAEHVN